MRQIFKKSFKRLQQPFKPVLMNKNKDYSDYEIGEWTYGYPKVLYNNGDAMLTIGRFCGIGQGTSIILGGEHRKDFVTSYPFPYFFKNARRYSECSKSKGDVIICNDVLIGYGVTILSGVRIGNGAVIGARAVVTKNVAPYSIVTGIPARHFKFRFNESIIKDLKTIAWWDWPMDKIEEAWPLLLSDNVEEFIAKYRK